MEEVLNLNMPSQEFKIVANREKIFVFGDALDTSKEHNC